MSHGPRPRASVSQRGAERWIHGHPWIYASDVAHGPPEPGVVAVFDPRGKFQGQALYSPWADIRLPVREREERPIDEAWWEKRIAHAFGRRAGIAATAYRVVHGEGDGLPSLIVDRYDRWLVVQLLSAGLETLRSQIIGALQRVLAPEGILLRNDAAVRRHESLPETVELAWGDVPREVVVEEAGVEYLAAPWSGQKTGAVLGLRA